MDNKSLLVLWKAQLIVKSAESMNEINAKFLLAKANNFSGGIDRNIKSILKNHSIRAEIPTGKVIRFQEVFCKNCQLQFAENFAVSLN